MKDVEQEVYDKYLSGEGWDDICRVRLINFKQMSCQRIITGPSRTARARMAITVQKDEEKGITDMSIEPRLLIYVRTLIPPDETFQEGLANAVENGIPSTVP